MMKTFVSAIVKAALVIASFPLMFLFISVLISGTAYIFGYPFIGTMQNSNVMIGSGFLTMFIWIGSGLSTMYED